MREVYDGWSKWRARIIPAQSPFRRRYGFRFVKERYFVNWQQEGVSKFYYYESDCINAAEAWLDSKFLEGRLI